MNRISIFFALAWPLLLPGIASAEFSAVADGRAVADLMVDPRGTVGNQSTVMDDAANWLNDSVFASTGVRLPRVDTVGDRPAIVLSLAENWPNVVENSDLPPESYEGFCIATTPQRVFIVGNSAVGVQHGVAEVLNRIGFRWFAPSPRWHHTPKLTDVKIDVNMTAVPALADRGIWYAYGNPGTDRAPLMQNYRRWAVANRLSVQRRMRTGHSYGNVINRNKEVFEKHDEYYALLENGQRDNSRAINARKFCYSNPELIELVTQDRIKLLEEYQKVDPAAFMISMDPSDGEGTCHCDECAKIGTTTDRVFFLANAVARAVRLKHPEAWVGLYAYSSHRLPPTIKIEPNVYVQVAMGFNRTDYTLPELVDAWSKKVGAIGLREYYGVEAWDWGLPGRMRGGKVDYHRKWIPYYYARKLNAINAETNANWAAQTVGLYAAARMMWDPDTDPDVIVDEFLEKCFGEVSDPIRRLYARFDEAPPLRAATLLPMFRDVEQAWNATTDDRIRGRLSDLMSYLVYVAKFREFDLVRSRSSERGDAYYQALEPLMNYAWRTSARDMVHYYALARRLCNGLPIADKRPDFYMFNKERNPVWMVGDQLSDAEIREQFERTIDRLEADGDPTVVFSRYFEPVHVAGDDAGASQILGDSRPAVAKFRRGLRGYLVPPSKQTVEFGITPASRQISLTVFARADTVLFEREFRKLDGELQTVAIELPKANEYRVEITGEFTLRVPAETPFLYEASANRPAWVDYSGPHYFYVPRGTRELIVDAAPRLSLTIPGQKKRIDIVPADRVAGRSFVTVAVPADADGKIWHTTNMTRGQFSLLNVPPLLSFHRSTTIVPREIAEADGLTTQP